MSEVKYAIAILKEKLANADRHNLAYQRLSIAEMEAIWGTLEKSDKDCATLKAERDALAAENVALINAHPQPFGPIMMQALDAYEKDREQEPETGMLNAFFILRDSINIQTPATDAYLNAVRADGVDLVAEAIGAKCAELKIGSKDWKALKSIVFMLGDFSAQLRSGEPS